MEDRDICKICDDLRQDLEFFTKSNMVFDDDGLCESCRKLVKCQDEEEEREYSGEMVSMNGMEGERIRVAYKYDDMKHGTAFQEHEDSSGYTTFPVSSGATILFSADWDKRGPRRATADDCILAVVDIGRGQEIMGVSKSEMKWFEKRKTPENGIISTLYGSTLKQKLMSFENFKQDRG